MTPPLFATAASGSGRLGPTIVALIGLAAAVMAARAFVRVRTSGRPSSRSVDARPITLSLGITAAVFGAYFLGEADSGPGTGDGVVGSGAAIVLGVLAIALDRSATRRRQRYIDSSSLEIHSHVLKARSPILEQSADNGATLKSHR